MSSQSNNPLSGKLCVVTGGTRGIGHSIAKMFLTHGASVALCGRDQGSVDRAVAELAAATGGKVIGKAADVKKHEDVSAFFQYVDQEFGAAESGLDVLVNNA